MPKNSKHHETRLISRRHVIAAGAGAAALVSMPSIVRAQAWPSKPIKIVCGFAAGGQTDQFSRVYGEYIARELGQPVVVENKTGASGALAAMEVKRADPDGYTLMMSNTGTYMLNPLLQKDVKYSVADDFVFVSMMPTGGLPLLISEKIGAKTLAEFIAYARKAERVNLGTYAAGSYAHVVINELNRQYGLKIEPVHYRGEAPMWTDLMGQSIDGGIGSFGAALPAIQAGKAHAVAVTRRRLIAMPEVQTFAEQGVVSRANNLLTFQACAAPAKTPPEIVARLSALFVAAAKTEKIADMLKKQSIDEPPMTAEASAASYRQEAPIWSEMVASLGPIAQ